MSGRAASFAEEVAAHRPRLMRYALRLTRRDRNRAEDLVQETLLRALSRGPGYFEVGTDMGKWLGAIMHNEYVSSVRRFKRRADVISPVSVDEFVTSEETSRAFAVEGGQGLSDDMRSLRKALSVMPSHHVRVVALIADGRKYDEIAAELQIPLGTVRSRLARARDLICAMMDEPRRRRAA